ncbi:hypothetical protein ABZ801_40465 [Actinomadura sp. NPDC047616]|uniref:hypothetical protein n=1 Tax=Actinomadura sp. NPDC047616 TaxID=3155914 RepID=UPI0033C3BA72
MFLLERFVSRNHDRRNGAVRRNDASAATLSGHLGGQARTEEGEKGSQTKNPTPQKPLLSCDFATPKLLTEIAAAPSP